MSQHPPTLVDHLNHVIAHDRSALETCDLAATRMSALRPRHRLRELASEHLRRIDKLSHHVTRLGGQPTRHKQPLALARDEVKAIDGDRSLLRAVLENEEQVTEAYESVVDREHTMADLDDLLSRQVRRQHRYRTWLRQHVAAPN